MRLVTAIWLLTACGVDAPGGDDTQGDAGPYFEHSMFWNRDVSATPKAANSDTTIAALRAAGGWGNADTFQIDFSIDVLTANASTPTRTFTKTADFYSPDCDFVPVPVPSGGSTA